MISARPVKGTFRRLRWAANAVLIAILFAIPWIRIGGEPLVLLDVPRRQFHVFGLVIFPQELYFLWLILAALALALFFFTALAGRLWCGWACPQTVFTDVFAGVARRIEGWKGAKRPAHVARWRLVAKHAVWIALAWVVAFHLIAYFRSPYELVGNFVRDGSIEPTPFAFHMAIAALIWFDLVVVRQTFCRVLCPYARFQSVLFDRNTLVVGYDTRRGEPRGKKDTTPGDCVDCGLCVAVCPTGIDIREGMQMECIACTQCIDACNGVMQRIGRARNLIGYRSLVGLEGAGPARLVRPRTLFYGALLVCVAVTFTALVDARVPMDLQVEHGSRDLYTTMADGRIGNSFDLHIQNRDRVPRSFRLRLADADAFELIAGQNPVPVPATTTAQTKVFVVPRAGRAPASRPIRFVLEPMEDGMRSVVRNARFVAPGGVAGRAPGGPDAS